MTGRKIPEGWQAFTGTKYEYVKQSNWVKKNISCSVEEFVKNFGLGSTKTQRNFYAIKNMERISS